MNQRAAAEPAAAEPIHVCRRCGFEGEPLVKTIESGSAAQPPRGSANASENSLPDPIVEVVGLGDGTMNVKTASGMRWHLTEAEYFAWPRIGGSLPNRPIDPNIALNRPMPLGASLTATEPPLYCDHGRPIGPPCSECATGSPRGVTPALDVERLAEALRASPSLLLEGDDKDRREFAAYIAAEYARLGSLSLQGSPDQEDSQ